MKRISLSLLALLLCLSALLASCTAVDPNSLNVPILNMTTADANQPSSPSSGTPITGPTSLIGKWYSPKGGYVFQFFTDGKMKSYALTPGFYEYELVSEGTYTYEDRLLSITLTDGSTLSSKLTATADGFEMLADSQVLAFSPVDELPVEHIYYTHPDYEALAAKQPLSSPSLTGHTISAAKLYAETLESMQTSYWSDKTSAEMVKLTEGVVAEGDRVNIAYTGLLNGVAFEGGTSTGSDVTAKDGTGMIDGFCSSLIGHEVGETFDAKLTFPTDYHSADLAGQEVVFRMTINCIYDLTLTDGIAINMGYGTVVAWQQAEFEKVLKEQVWTLLADKMDPNVPAEAYTYQAASLYEYYRSSCFYYFANDYEKFLTYIGMTDAELLEYCYETNRELGSSLFWAAQIVAAFELTADDALIEQVTEDFIATYTEMGYAKDVVLDYMENEGALEFRAQILNELAVQYLLENNTFSKD